MVFSKSKKVRSLVLIFILSLCLYSVQAQQNTVEISGKVYAKDNGKPLFGANVIALDSDSVSIAHTTSNEEGEWMLKVTQSPFQIVVSYVGFESFVYNRNALNQDFPIHLTPCYLLPNTQLNELSVAASRVEHLIDAEKYLITEEMRSKASNTMELLDQIHGLRFDKVANAIRVGNETEILFLVDGLERSKDYILTIDPNRIATVEVNKSPKGRYMSEGYAAMINVNLKKDRIGYDVYLNNFSIVNLSGNNGDDWLHTEQPMVNLTYTHKKFSAYALYAYGRAFWNTPMQKYVKYEGVQEKKSEVTTKDNPNDLYDYQGNVLVGGLNYAINANHTLALEGNYTFSKIQSDRWFNYQIQNYGLPGLSENVQKLEEKSRNATRSKDWTGTLYYQGKFLDKWEAYADVSYNFFDNDLNNRYQQDSRILIDNTYKEKRKLVGLNLDLTYTLSDKMNLNFGYSNQYRKYESESLNKESLLDYSENRHQLFAYFKYQPSSKWGFEIGTGLEYLRRKASADKEDYWNLLPYANLNYNFNDNLNVRLSYKSSMQYPMLDQLNPVVLQIDSLMTSQGNPYLKSSVLHSSSVDINLWNKITITPKMEWNNNRIGDLITEMDNHKHLVSPVNLKMRRYSVLGVYDQPLNDYFSLSNSLQYYYTKVKYGKESRSGSGWLIDSSVGYFNPTHSLMVQLNYARTVDKEVYIQGYQMMDLDAWSLTAMKQFFNGKASVMLTYTLPIEWGLRKGQKREILAPNYTERMNISLKPYRSMLMVHLTYRFGSGKVNFFKKKSEILKEERIKRTVNF